MPDLAPAMPVRERGWDFRVRAGLLVGLFLVLFLPALSRMVYVYWHDGNYSYGFFIPLVSLFWIHLNRDRLAGVRARASWTGLLLLAPSLLIYLAATAIDPPSHVLMRFAMLATLVGLVILLAGWRVFFAYLFPIAYLAVMFPLSKSFEESAITLPLQRYAARAGAAVIESCGIPLVRDGNVIKIPAMDLLVEDACSGIRSLFSLTALSIAMVFLFEKRWWEKILLLLLTPPIAVLANVLRVASTGLLAQWVSQEFASGFLHYFQGLSIFLVGMGLLLLCAWIVRVLVPPPEPPPSEKETGDG